ncbi:MAG: YggT family protein [Candidatus Sericytochromatia bacterium]|nr:YggT family protein [Candidatus Tanganyikabacteria bacterium]
MITLLREVLGIVFQVWSFLLLAWVILSWIPSIPRYHPVVQTVERLVEPTIRPFRRLLPGLGPIDVSPLIAIAVYQMVWLVLDRMLAEAAGGFY